MKKFLVLGMMAMLVLVGCSQQQKDTYVIATDTAFPPFEYTNDKNEFVGIDVDLINAIAKNQNFKIDLRSIGFSAGLTALESGQADGLIAGMSITEDRKEKYDFSDPYFEVYVTMGVKQGSNVKALEDLKGKNVAIKEGTNSAAYAESIKDQYGFTVSYFDSSPTMYQEVILGNSAACFEDEPILEYNVKNGVGLETVPSIRTSPTPYAFAVLKGKNADLLKQFNAGLKALKEDGSFDKIVAEYTK